MNQKNILFIMLIIVGLKTFSQTDFMKYGKIDSAEYFTNYPADTSVSAIVLGEWTSVTYNNFKQNTEHHIRIKILNESALHYGEVKITYPFLGDVTRIKGVTYNYENGSFVKSELTPENIYTTKAVGELYIKSFALPKIKKGSVIEYAFYKEDLRIETNWSFQQEIPVVKSVYSIEIPSFFNYSVVCEHCEKTQNLVEYKNGDKASGFINSIKKLTWIATDIPPFYSEPFLKNKLDNRVRVELELNGKYVNQRLVPFPRTYPEYCNSLLKYNFIYSNLDKHNYLNTDLKALFVNEDTTLNNLKIIYDYIKNRFLCDNKNTIQPDVKLKESYDLKKGSIADVNLNLLMMLREAHFECYPLFLSTRDNKKIYKDKLLVHRFNYVIVCVFLDGKQYFLDASNPLYVFNELPFKCLNESGLLIKKDSDIWLDLLRNEKFETKNIIDLTINPNLQVNGTIKSLYNGLSSFQIREEIKNSNIDQYIEKEKSKESNKQLTNFKFKNLENINDTLEVICDFTNVESIQTNNKIYLDAISLGEYKTNPFVSNDRHSPVSFGCPKKESIIINYTFPKEYTIESLPKAINIELPQKAGVLTLTTSSSDQHICISSTIEINKTDFSVDEYPKLKEFYNQIINSQTQQIVLKKQ